MLILSVDILSFLVSLVRSLSFATRDPLQSFHCSIVPSLPLSPCPRIIFTGENGGAPNKEPSQQASPSVTTAMAAATTTTAASTTTAITYSGSPSQNLPRRETEVRRCLIRVSSVKKGEVSSSHNFDTMQ